MLAVPNKLSILIYTRYQIILFDIIALPLPMTFKISIELRIATLSV